MGKITLSDRDIRLLTLLGQCGVMKPEQTKMVYGNVTSYHRLRIQKLVSARLLIRDHGYIRPSAAGLQKAGIPAKPLRLERYRYEEHAIAVELVSQLPDWTPVYARELKLTNQIQRQSRICVAISRNNVQYAVYILADNPRAATLAGLRSDMDSLHLKRRNPKSDSDMKGIRVEMNGLSSAGINKALIFCTSADIMQTIGNEPPAGLLECCLLPYPQGVDAFRRYHSKEFAVFLQKRFPGLKQSKYPFAHYEYQDAFITILIHNDLVKRAALITRTNSFQHKHGRRCVAVCTPGQEIDLPDVEAIYDAVDE